MINNFSYLKNQIISDYFLKPRLREYEKIIETLLENGYTIISVRDFVKKLLEGDKITGRVFINRHDIDTDINTAKEFLFIEKNIKLKQVTIFVY